MKVGVMDARAYLTKVAYKDQIASFKSIAGEIGEAQGWTLEGIATSLIELPRYMPSTRSVPKYALNEGLLYRFPGPRKKQNPFGRRSSSQNTIAQEPFCTQSEPIEVLQTAAFLKEVSRGIRY